MVGGDRLLLETTRQSAGEKRTSCAAEEGRAGVETSVGLLACAAARAFACSLLEKRVSGGVDGDTPASTRSWESVVSLVWRQPEWVARCTVVIDVQQREFVIYSGASMHMISKKDLNSAELETVTTSRSPTTVITANGEVQTHEEATVYVRELDIFLTMRALENTPAVLSLGKVCDEHGYSYEWINGQKPHLIKNGIRIQCTETFVPIIVPGL